MKCLLDLTGPAWLVVCGKPRLRAKPMAQGDSKLAPEIADLLIGLRKRHE